MKVEFEELICIKMVPEPSTPTIPPPAPVYSQMNRWTEQQVIFFFKVMQMTARLLFVASESTGMTLTALTVEVRAVKKTKAPVLTNPPMKIVFLAYYCHGGGRI